MRKVVQAKNIEDDRVIGLVRALRTKSSDFWKVRPGQHRWVMVFEIEQALSEFPPKVVLAKVRSMLRRKVLGGCGCGCRGDLVLPEMSGPPSRRQLEQGR